jgi:hypothetical protein
MTRAAEASRNRGWSSQLGDLERNLNATYEAVRMGFTAQSAAFTEAWKEVETVLNAVSQRHQTIATIVGVFLTFAASFAGKAVEGLLTRVTGRLGGALSATTQAGIVAGLTDVMKSGIQAPSGLIRYQGEMPTGAGYSDPDSFHRNGAALIAREKYAATNFTTWLGNNRDELEQADFSPADVLERLAGELASLRMAGEEAQATTSPRRLEIALWKSWVEENGSRVVSSGYLGMSVTKLDVPKEVLDRLENDLGIPESLVRTWAGV